ncbi:DUF3341 domain-containing protein [Sulfuriroseicoccus oceanibius]|uniref:DUF3341 domain-containing protein n=1 Tax=Sulfuriroseicoccus oceanibius TaxID=2707525 RepID=A0A6B3LCS9_9BACT|nr:DUF3341 domain-containing protein [Sulfuriroseicoccus oceanibius]QQL44638.1 DUF3341 domain-containing protein [Sulfuriroseicoccus oceanibius]
MKTGIKKVYGYLARFETPTDLYKAAAKVRDKGFKKWDAYSSFPIHGMDAAMGLGRSKLPFFVFFGGMTGTLTALALQFGTQVALYPTIVQAKPTNLFTIPAYFPVTFELTVLFSAFTTLFGMLALSQLPRMNHPLFESEQFKRVTDDGFFIAIEARDPRFNREQTREFLSEIGGSDIELVEEQLS